MEHVFIVTVKLATEEIMMNEVSCFCCNKEFRPATPEAPDEINHPQDGTVFIAWGNYGSTVHDPVESSFLEINVCDECLVERADKVLIASLERGKETQYSNWDPPERHFQLHVQDRPKRRLNRSQG